MSQHLAVLRGAGLVMSRRAGSTVLYRLADDRVRELTLLLASVAGGRTGSFTLSRKD
jgi:DNA-binding transcriptional ArsR family regulator